MLKVAALLNFLISLGHLASLFFINDAFKYVGIEKKMNELSSIHSWLPYIVTFGASVAFFIFGLYALSADGVIRKLPLLKFVFYLVSITFLARGVIGLWRSACASSTLQSTQNIFAIIAITIGLLFLIGGNRKF